MCDIEKERGKIDAIIDMNISPFWFEDARNQNALVDIAVRCLCENYIDLCSEECMRSRCEAHIARIMKRSAVSFGGFALTTR